MQDFRRLLKYLRPHSTIFIFAIIAMIFMALFETATLALLTPLLDQFQQNSAQNSWTLFNLQELIPQKPWYQAWLTISALL